MIVQIPLEGIRGVQIRVERVYARAADLRIPVQNPDAVFVFLREPDRQAKLTLFSRDRPPRVKIRKSCSVDALSGTVTTKSRQRRQPDRIGFPLFQPQRRIRGKDQFHFLPGYRQQRTDGQRHTRRLLPRRRGIFTSRVRG